MSTHYAVVTFGAPNTTLKRYYRSEERARRAADVAMGTGSCGCSRVYRCDSRALAISADISEIRDGETCVYSA